jgi:hypothetical protein
LINWRSKSVWTVCFRKKRLVDYILNALLITI